MNRQHLIFISVGDRARVDCKQNNHRGNGDCKNEMQLHFILIKKRPTLPVRNILSSSLVELHPAAASDFLDTYFPT